MWSLKSSRIYRNDMKVSTEQKWNTLIVKPIPWRIQRYFLLSIKAIDDIINTHDPMQNMGQTQIFCKVDGTHVTWMTWLGLIHDMNNDKKLVLLTTYHWRRLLCTFWKSNSFREVKFKDFQELKQVLQQHFDQKALVMAEQFCLIVDSRSLENLL